MFNTLCRTLKNKKGFTLVELMVVVVIIGILAAIAVPVYSGSQERAQIAAIQANVKVVQGAITQYLAVNNAYPDCDTVSELYTLLTGSTNGGPYLQSAPTYPTGATAIYTKATGAYSVTYKDTTYK